ncbi:MAG: HAD hydrolase-like protein [Desulfocapsaceae bacterium]|nr:HAD hydrolase-like protein [Desulfocapsaceae bacterium]
MLRLIIFDCDGVMFNSRAANREYYNQLLNRFSRPEMDEEELAYVHMHNANNSVEYIFRRFPDQDMDAVKTYCRGLDYSPFFRFMQMERDLIEFLEFAKPRYELAISTNRTDTMHPLLKEFNLLQYFGKIMTAGNARRPKPAPDALFEILDYFNCKADEAIYIGDSIIDRQHTEAAGMRLIAFKNPGLPAEFHVSSFMEICALPPLA